MILKGIPEVEELNGMVRFENHDELRYSLRSVFENLPWINHIYLILKVVQNGHDTQVKMTF